MSSIDQRTSARGGPTWEIAELFPNQGEWSVHEYLALNTNRLVEFCDGHVEVLPMPSEEHQLIAGFLYEVLKRFASARNLGTAVFAPLRVKLYDNRFREPDIVFMLAEHADRRHKKFWHGADLVMEVVSENGNVENELVEVARFPSSFEASLALGELEEAGISARLANEASSEWMTYLGTHDVGVGLLTSSADAEKARNILEQREQVDEIPDQGEEEAGAEGEDESEVRGPEDWAKRALLSAFAGLFIFPFSLYAIWIVIRRDLLSRRNMVSIRGPLTTLVVAVIGLVINLLFIVGQFFQ